MTPKVIFTEDTLKSVRETLCVAQAFIGLHDKSNRTEHHTAVLQRLINDIDRQRPLGPDGKHDDRHTQFCGCDDK